MPTSLDSPDVQDALDGVRPPTPRRKLTPSPADWRDQWIYFLIVDRFNNPDAPPRHEPFDVPYGAFQGGTLEGIRQKLGYLKRLGAGAIWLTPVLKNCQFLNGAPNGGTYHGYGIQNFLELDPRFASDPARVDDEFIALVDEAHRKGLYVILDIVLNHAGDVFAYECDSPDDVECRRAGGSLASWRDAPRAVRWRDGRGIARAGWSTAEQLVALAPDAAIFPDEMRRNAFFRRQGMPRGGGADTVGDFASLKQLRTDDTGLASILIRAFQYLIARYDIDGFRVDTLKYLDRSFAAVFGNAIREYALSVGKKNFFTFGEVYDDERQIARFIGRNALDPGDLVGVDAALDFPLFFRLPAVLKGFRPPSDIVEVYQRRKEIERGVISSHGEATRFFVTFLDNHDQHERFHYVDPWAPRRYEPQAVLGLACLFTLPGIPCLYYGTEQGLHGSGESDQDVREALWGKPKAFGLTSPFCRAIQQLTRLRAALPALRYGRYYFRPLSGDGVHYGISYFPGGVLAFSRILNDQEIVIVGNTSVTDRFVGSVIVDANLHPVGTLFTVLFSNQKAPTGPGTITSTGLAAIHEVDGGVSDGPAAVLPVTLAPMEVQVLGRAVGGGVEGA